MKTSNKLIAAATLVLAVIPAVSAILNINGSTKEADKLNEIVSALRTDTITVLQYTSPKASPGLMYVVPVKASPDIISLNIQPKVTISGDTLSITSDDKSGVYQGTVRLHNLKEARFNSVSKYFFKTKKTDKDTAETSSPDTITHKKSVSKTTKI